MVSSESWRSLESYCGQNARGRGCSDLNTLQRKWKFQKKEERVDGVREHKALADDVGANPEAQMLYKHIINMINIKGE